MNAELRVTDLEEARKKLKAADAKLERRLIVREAYFAAARRGDVVERVRGIQHLFELAPTDWRCVPHRPERWGIPPPG